MNNYPGQLVINSETAHKLLAHSIVLRSPSITVDEFNSLLSSTITGLLASNESNLHDEANRLANMQLWTTGQLKRLGVWPLGEAGDYLL